MPKQTITMKIACQPKSSMVKPPNVGATAGPTAMTIPMRFITRADASWVKRSRTIAREIVPPPAAPTPCRNRAISNISIVVENSAKTLAAR